MAAAGSRINPTLFDKLVGDLDMSGLRADEGDPAAMHRDRLKDFSVPRLEKFNERALRSTVKRELGWLLNTTHLGAVIDLEPYPQVQSSVLNYGVPDLAGKASGYRLMQQRARDIRDAIRQFEPRIDRNSLSVEPQLASDRSNAVTYVINCDVTSAVQAMPVKFVTEVEAESANVQVRD